MGRQGWKEGCAAESGNPAGTTMHLIINSLDTRRDWCLTGFRQERSRRRADWRRDLLQKWRTVENDGSDERGEVGIEREASEWRRWGEEMGERKRMTADGVWGKEVQCAWGRLVAGMAFVDAAQRSIYHVMPCVTSLSHTPNHLLSFTFSLSSLLFTVAVSPFLFPAMFYRCFLDFVT